MMARYYPDSGWLRLRRDVLAQAGRLQAPARPGDVGRDTRRPAGRCRDWSAAMTTRRSRRQRRALRGLRAVSLSPDLGEEPPPVQLRGARPKGRGRARRPGLPVAGCAPSAWCRAMPARCCRWWSASFNSRHLPTKTATAIAEPWLEATEARRRPAGDGPVGDLTEQCAPARSLPFPLRRPRGPHRMVGRRGSPPTVTGCRCRVGNTTPLDYGPTRWLTTTCCRSRSSPPTRS